MAYDRKVDIDGEVFGPDEGMHHTAVYFDNWRKYIACHEKDRE